MKNVIILSFLVINSLFANVISCGDILVLKEGSEARYELHKSAQQRAQRSAEDFMGKKITNPFPLLFSQNKKGELKNLIPTIEIFWCESSTTPLHSAYYSFYMNNKSCWE